MKLSHHIHTRKGRIPVHRGRVRGRPRKAERAPPTAPTLAEVAAPIGPVAADCERQLRGRSVFPKAFFQAEG